MAGRAAVAALAASFGILACAGCGGTREAKPADRLEWSQPNANNASTRAVHGPAAPATVDRLRVRWRFRLRGEPGFSGIDAATPVVSNGRIYLQDLNSDVYAVSLANGRLLWRHRYGQSGRRAERGRGGERRRLRQHRYERLRSLRTDRSRALADAAHGRERTPSRSRRSSRTGSSTRARPASLPGAGARSSPSTREPGRCGGGSTRSSVSGASLARHLAEAPGSHRRWMRMGASTGAQQIRIRGVARARARTEACTPALCGTPTRS